MLLNPPGTFPRLHQEYPFNDGTDLTSPPGDCVRTALAVVLGLPRDEVPHFLRYSHIGQDPDDLWFWALQGWCAHYGYRVTYIRKPGLHAGPHVLCGLSPRGTPHAVAAYDDVIVWDPHPTGGGLVQATSAFLLREAVWS